jgi:hypothetical protein
LLLHLPCFSPRLATWVQKLSRSPLLFCLLSFKPSFLPLLAQNSLPSSTCRNSDLGKASEFSRIKLPLGLFLSWISSLCSGALCFSTPFFSNQNSFSVKLIKPLSTGRFACSCCYYCCPAQSK